MSLHNLLSLLFNHLLSEKTTKKKKITPFRRQLYLLIKLPCCSVHTRRKVQEVNSSYQFLAANYTIRKAKHNRSTAVRHPLVGQEPHLSGVRGGLTVPMMCPPPNLQLLAEITVKEYNQFQK